MRIEKTEKNIFKKIINKCLYLDRVAFSLYDRFAKESKEPTLAKEWRKIAEEEKGHMVFWKKALDLSENDSLPDIFDDPESVLNRLERFNLRIKEAVSAFKAYDDQNEALSLSFLLESYMLDPAFMMMFHSFRFIDENIEKEYERHICEFVDLMRLQSAASSDSTSPQVEFFCETLMNLYNLNKRLLKEKSTDNLTGLFNRAGFFNSIEPLLGLASRNSLSVGIIMADIDKFKSINDTYGHPVGDKALKAAASLIESSLRKSDILGRYGGEEFIIFAASEDISSLEALCERIRKNIEEKSEKLCGIHFSISLGAALSKIGKSEKKTLTKLINDADKNLLTAKKMGRNRWIV